MGRRDTGPGKAPVTQRATRVWEGLDVAASELVIRAFLTGYMKELHALVARVYTVHHRADLWRHVPQGTTVTSSECQVVGDGLPATDDPALETGNCRRNRHLATSSTHNDFRRADWSE
jgi:hypothetical protein